MAVTPKVLTGFLVTLWCISKAVERILQVCMRVNALRLPLMHWRWVVVLLEVSQCAQDYRLLKMKVQHGFQNVEHVIGFGTFFPNEWQIDGGYKQLL